MDKKLEAQRLRKSGETYAQIGKKLGVSHATVHNYVNGYGHKLRSEVGMCGFLRLGSDDTCERQKGHRGVHLSDKSGRLVWW